MDVIEVNNPNRHIYEYLNYYLNLDRKPYYAVLLNGVWGLGKTFTIKRLLGDVFPTGKEYIYISLYGVSDKKEIDRQILEAEIPVLGNRYVKALTIPVKALAKATIQLEAEIDPLDLLSIKTEKILIFDDLERVAMPVSEALGYINSFVEHDGNKVIVIANEDKFTEDSEYLSKREKTIGKVLEVQADIDRALKAFIGDIKNPKLKKMFEEALPVVRRVYQQFGLNNLRILKQTIWDFERVYESLDDKYTANEEAMVNLLEYLLIFEFEFKAGRIKSEDLFQRLDILIMYRVGKEKDKDPPRLQVMSERYKPLELSATLLSDEVLNNIVTKGIVDGAEIQKCLDESLYFITEGSEPNWKTAWHFLEREDEAISNAIASIEKDFEKREFLDPGVILHVMGLRLRFADLLGKTIEDIKQEGEEYITDLYESKKLEPSDSRRREPFLDTGYESLGYACRETKEFKYLYNHLSKKREEAFVRSLPNEAEELFKEMQTDSDLFWRRLNYGNSNNDSTFAGESVLQYIEPSKFVSVLCKASAENQWTLIKAIRERYRSGRLEREFSEEKEWLGEVREELKMQLPGENPVTVKRINFLTEVWLDKTLASLPTDD